MSILTPSCLGDFLINDAHERLTLELILARKLPFPFNGKSGILLHGTYGTGKSTLGFLLPHLFETADSGKHNLSANIGQLQATEEAVPELFRCGGGLSSTKIVGTIYECNGRSAWHHYKQFDYFVFDEVDKLTPSAQQSLKSVMDLKRSQFIFTTNFIDRVDDGIINRCHLIGMHQANSVNTYLPIGKSLLQKMQLPANALPDSVITGFAVKAKGSLRNFLNDVMIEGISVGGVI